MRETWSLLQFASRGIGWGLYTNNTFLSSSAPTARAAWGSLQRLPVQGSLPRRPRCVELRAAAAAASANGVVIGPPPPRRPRADHVSVRQ